MNGPLLLRHSRSSICSLVREIRQTHHPEALRAATQLENLQLDADADREVELGTVWNHLVSGRWRVSDDFATDARLYVLVRAQCPPAVAPEVDLLRRTLLGERQKTVALDTELSPSTVATRLSISLARMGFSPRPARVPILLVAAAVATLGEGALLPRARATRWASPDGEVTILSAPRLDGHLREILTPAEWIVARLLIDGLSHREIATSRDCSVRTVANQIASIFRKLKVSGRAELLLSAVSGYVERSAADVER